MNWSFWNYFVFFVKFCLASYFLKALLSYYMFKNMYTHVKNL